MTGHWEVEPQFGDGSFVQGLESPCQSGQVQSFSYLTMRGISNHSRHINLWINR